MLFRSFENELFYDPFLSYFKTKKVPFPKLNYGLFFLNLFWRYFLNSLLSVGLIWIVFKDYNFLKLSCFLYVVFFVVLVMFLFLILYWFTPDLKLLLFYVRRFLIQPIFVLIFLPGFYYHKTVHSVNN